MTNEPIDWTKMPLTGSDDREWYGVLMADSVNRLTRHHAAIKKWNELVQVELRDLAAETAGKRHPAWEEHGYDPVGQEAEVLLDTERAMFGSLGVAIAATAENFIVGICKDRKIPLTDEDGESDFGIICCNFNAALKVIVSSLPGYAGNQRARLLGNCFKHNDGRTDARFAKKYKEETEGRIIAFEAEEWDGMISATETLLREIVQRL